MTDPDKRSEFKFRNKDVNKGVTPSEMGLRRRDGEPIGDYLKRTTENYNNRPLDSVLPPTEARSDEDA